MSRKWLSRHGPVPRAERPVLPAGTGCESHFRNLQRCESGFRNASPGRDRPARAIGELTGRPTDTSQDSGARKAFRNARDISRQQNGPKVGHATRQWGDIHSIGWCISDNSPVSW
ncbi:hypothetical protein DMC63_19440 [Streptomyces sp. WAC 05977]|nr:hypothetical protein DMC63_19440 [Streptomyces sp. WAC 05977]